MARYFSDSARVAQGRRKAKSYTSFLEALEPRQMLSVDIIPDWSFVGASTTINHPSPLIAGDVMTGTAKFAVKALSSGSATGVPSPTTINIQLFARPTGAVDSSTDLLINKAPFSVSISNLAPGSAKAVSIPFLFNSLTEGEYTIVSLVDAGDVLVESNEENNSTTFGTYTIVAADRDLSLAIDPANVVPTSPAVSDGTTKRSVKLILTNIGNKPTVSSQTATFTVIAHRTSDDQEFPVQTFSNVKIGTINPTKTKKVTLSPVLPLGMESGNYVLKVVMTTDIPSDEAGDNTGSTVAFDVTRGFVDISADITSTTIPVSLIQGTTKTGTLKVDVSNIGNVALPANQHVDVNAYLRPNGATDNTQDILIGTKLNQSLNKLAPNKAKNIPINISLSNTLNSDAYTFVVTATPVEALTEELLTNNSDASNTITIAPAFVDLAFVTSTVPFTANAAGGATGTATVTLINNGNVTATGPITITYYATTGTTIDGNATAIGSTTITNINLGVGKTSSVIKIPLTLPNPANTTSLNILAKITVNTSPADTNSSNDATPVLATTSTSHVDSIWGPGRAHPTVIKFGPNTSGSPGFHTGNLLDTSGNIIGTYMMTVPGATPPLPPSTNVLGLTFTGFSPLGSNPIFTGAEAFFAGKTVTFSFSSVGAKGSIQVNGNTVYFKY